MKHVIVTGGAGGIGTYISEDLIKKGYYLSIIGRDKKRFDKLVSLIGKTDNLNFIKADVSNNNEVKEIFSLINKNNLELYALINMAALQAPIDFFDECDINEWTKNISINLIGVANMVYEFIIATKKYDYKKKIINFSGGGATSNRANFSAYAVSKIGVVKLTEILSSELSDFNIDINSVAPGSINTKMLDEVILAGHKAGEEYENSLLQINNGGDPVENIVNLCFYLLSSESDGISGKIISAIWDDYNKKGFLKRLRTDPDFCTLRRIDLINFDKKE